MCRLGMHIAVHPGRVAIVDGPDWMVLPKTGWTLRITRWGEYAVRKTRRGSKTIYTYMHRLIMETPRGIEVHHRNHYGLDNRRLNMINLTPSEHKDITRMEQIAIIR